MRYLALKKMIYYFFRQMSSRNVCESFFNFDGDFNRGHGIVSAIHFKIYKCKEANYEHFKFLKKQIIRSSRKLNSKEEFRNLLNLALKNVSDDYNEDYICWTLVGYLFYVSDRVDEAAQENLDQIAYDEFKANMITDLTEKLQQLFGDHLTEFQWKIFSLSQTLNSMKLESFHWTDFSLGVATLFLINKLLS